MELDNLTQRAIRATEQAQVAYYRFIKPNETGATGSHQDGFLIQQEAYALAFDKPCKRGDNYTQPVIIKWNDDIETQSTFKYYGRLTRNEYRLTGFGRGFPFLQEENIGDMLVLCKKAEGQYLAYVLSEEQQIDDFRAFFDLSPTEKGGLIRTGHKLLPDINSEILQYVGALSSDLFPDTQTIALQARAIYEKCTGHNGDWLIKSPDAEVIARYDMEYTLFKAIENKLYEPFVTQPLGSVEKLTDVANTVLNRRKSRAGRALERQLEHIFDINHIPYSAQQKTEGKQKPDFIMPSIETYHLASGTDNSLIMLASKTTCKDRWRQVLQEARKVKRKHIFTLQPGISSNQLDEMKEADLTVVIPAQNRELFPPEHREDLMTLKDFIGFTKERLSL